MNHGGARDGAGRPKGSRNRRHQSLVEELNGIDCHPATRLAHIAQHAELEGNLSLAADCYKALMPYLHPKVKSASETRESQTIHVITGVPDRMNDHSV
jgi:hypothetical protein